MEESGPPSKNEKNRPLLALIPLLLSLTGWSSAAEEPAFSRSRWLEEQMEWGARVPENLVPRRPAAAPGVPRQARRGPPAPRRHPEGGGPGERRHPRSHRRPRPAGDRDGAVLRHRSREPQASPGRLSGRPFRGWRVPRAHGRRLLQRGEHLARGHHPQPDPRRRRAVPAHVGPLGGLRPGRPRVLRLPGLRRDEPRATASTSRPPRTAG